MTSGDGILLNEHRRAGARLREGTPEVLAFGDVPGEYRAAREACAAFDATALGTVEAKGAEAVEFLHRITANDVRGLAVGRSQTNLLLSSKGKVLFDFELFRAADRLVLALNALRAPPLAEALEAYHFSEKVTFAVTSEHSAPIELCGPGAAAIVAKVAKLDALPSERGFVETRFEGGPLLVAELPVAGARGWRLDAGPEHAGALWRALLAAGARPAGLVARDILRIEAGAALWSADVDENVYPQEARLESAFSLTKGCYTGQEVVAKIDTYGGLNKRLVALRVSHDDALARGTRLYKLDEGEWRDLGVVTSWAYSFVLDTGLALAHVKRRHQKTGTEFRVGDGPATATVVPLPVRPDAIAPTGEFE